MNHRWRTPGCLLALVALILPLITSLAAPQATTEAQVAAPGRKVIVDARDAATLNELRQAGAQQLVDYGSFSLWRTSETSANRLNGRDSVSQRDDFDQLSLRANSFSPLAGVPAAPSGLQQTRSAGGQLWLVQFVGPTKDAWLADLEQAGLDIVSYIPNHAYLVWGDGDALGRLDRLAARSPVIQWTGPYHPDYRIAPAVKARLDNPSGAERPSEKPSEKPEPSAENASLVDVTVQFYASATVERSLAALLALGGTVHRSPERILGYLNVSLALPADRIASVAGWPDVVNVEPWVAPQKHDEVQNQIIAGNVISVSGNVIPSGPGYLTWLGSKGFPMTPSSYPVVDVVDDGVDGGNEANILHPDFYELGVKPGTDRVVYIDNCTTDLTGNAVGGHGNLNAGIAAGYNNLTGFPYTDTLGYRIGLGVSPYGRVAGTKIFRNFGGFDVSTCGGTLAGLVARSYDRGANFTSNSWGAPVGGAYNADSQAYDALTRDARSTVAGNQQMLHIFSAGNSGAGGANTIGSPGTAKNVLTVGATENVRDDGLPSGCATNAANNADDIAGYSSRGPTIDSRVKPDIQAPGTHIQGPASLDPAFNGSGVCGAFGNNASKQPQDYYPSGQITYTWSTGTSHSAPAVSGAASLAWEYYGRVLNPGKTPSPAMLKALLVNSARYLTGVSANDTLPSNNQGWGDVNLGTLTDGSVRTLVDQSVVFGTTGAVYTATGTVVSSALPVRVTLAWTDAPGPTVGNAYVNDLDLEVTVGGSTYKGNVFSGRNSTTGGTADPRNNLEGVYLPAGVSGPFTVSVRAANIAGDGVPSNGDSTDQDFALVLTNLDAPMVTGVIAGLVTDGVTSAPVTGAEVAATTGNEFVYAATTDGTGGYRLPAPAGTYTMTTSHPNYAITQTFGVLVSLGLTTTVNVALTSRPVISGVVTDATGGAPLVGAQVTVAGPFGSFVTTTVAGGGYQLLVQPGLHTVTATLANYFPTVVTGVVATAQTTTTLNLSLMSLPVLTGTVTDAANGAPLSGASVTAVGPGGSVSGPTNAGGTYRLVVQPGTHTVTATHPAYLPGVATGVVATLATTTTANIALTGYPVLQGTGVTATDPAGNNDGRFVPGEIIDLRRGLTNTGTLTATGTTGVVSVIGGLAAMVQPSASYPTIGLRQAATNTTPYQALISLDRCPDVLTFRQVITSAGGITSTNTFEVATGISTASYAATDVPKVIPDSPAPGVTVPLTVTTVPGTVVQDLDVRLTISHSFVGDLILRLVSPAATVITLTNRRGGTGDNFTGTIFDDQATTAIASVTNANAPFTGRFRPEAPLATLIGQPISGTWQLIASDHAGSDIGSVLAFGLDFNAVDCTPNTSQIAIMAGTVTSIHTGEPISGAQVSVPVSALSVATTTTRSDGSYRLGIPASTVTATASEPRYLPAMTTGIAAPLGITTTVNFALTGFPNLVPAGILTDDVTLGNGNGVPEPGDALLIQLPLRNTGTNTATTTSSLVTLANGPATILQPASPYPTIALSVTMSNLSPYVAYLDPLAQCGDVVTFRQVVTTNFGLTSTQSLPLRIGLPVTDLLTTTYSYGGPPIAIPNNTSSVHLVPITVTVPITQLVADVDVRITISHTYSGDLDLSLISPAGTVVKLKDPDLTGFGSGDNFSGTTFDDQAATAITSGAPPFAGRFRPVQPLSALAGEPLSGTWKLRVEDVYGTADGGTINAFALDILPFQYLCQPVVRPTPGLSLLGPLGTVIGSPDFTLAVTGTGFFNYLSTLFWNGQPLSTSYVSTTMLQAQVPASLVAPTGPNVVGPGPRVPAGPISITVQTLGVVTPSNALIFDLAKANQSITFGPLVTRTAGTAAFALTATSSSGLPVQFTVQASSPGACTIAGTLVSPVAVGSCTVTASQPGNESYNPAAPVGQTFAILAVPPSATATPTPGGPTPTVGPRRIFLPVSARLDAGW